MPVESPRKIAQRKRKLKAQKYIKNTTILSVNLDPDVYILETKSNTLTNLTTKQPKPT